MRLTTSDLPFKVTDQRIVILKSLPALQCENCAQYVMEDAVLGRVDEILATGDGAAELEVIRSDGFWWLSIYSAAMTSG
jgi:hypothetical protein